MPYVVVTWRGCKEQALANIDVLFRQTVCEQAAFGSRCFMSFVEDRDVERRYAANARRYDRRGMIGRENNLDVCGVSFDKSTNLIGIGINTKVQVHRIQADGIIFIFVRYRWIGTDAQVSKIAPPAVMSAPFVERLLQQRQ